MATLLGKNRVGGIRLKVGRAGPVTEKTMSFLVEAASGDNEIDVIAATGVSLGSISEFGTARSIAANFRPDKTTLWDVVVEFSSESTDNGQDNADNDDPTTWVPVYETRFERLTEFVDTDNNGDLIENSAGQSYPIGRERIRHIPIWDFYQFEPATVTDEQVLERCDVLNNLEFKGRDPKTLLCVVESSTIGFYYGRRLRLTHYSLRYKKDTWLDKRPDLGTQYLDGSTLKDYRPKNSEIILGGLDGSGAPAGGITDGFPVDGTPAILEFNVYDAIDFNEFLR